MLFERVFSHFGSIKSNHPITDNISHDLTFIWSLEAFRKENNAVYLLKEKRKTKMCLVVTGNLLNGVTSTGVTKVNCCKSFNPVLAQVSEQQLHVILPSTHTGGTPNTCMHIDSYIQTNICKSLFYGYFQVPWHTHFKAAAAVVIAGVLQEGC